MLHQQSLLQDQGKGKSPT